MARIPRSGSPYLADVPTLDDRLLKQLAVHRPSPAACAEADCVIARLRQIIRQARERHERETGEQVIPERPVFE